VIESLLLGCDRERLSTERHRDRLPSQNSFGIALDTEINSGELIGARDRIADRNKGMQAPDPALIGQMGWDKCIKQFPQAKCVAVGSGHLALAGQGKTGAM